MSRRISIAKGVHARRFGDELVILDTAGAQYFGLNDVGADMWERLANGGEPNQIVGEIVALYAVESERARADLEDLMARLVDAGLAHYVPA
jgi:hypothetical protein